MLLYKVNQSDGKFIQNCTLVDRNYLFWHSKFINVWTPHPLTLTLPLKMNPTQYDHFKEFYSRDYKCTKNSQK